MNSKKSSAQTRPSSVTSFNQHSSSTRVIKSLRLSGPRCEATQEDIGSHQLAVCACAYGPVGWKVVQGDTNIHQSSWALVQNRSLKCSRVVLFQNTNVFLKRKRIFKGKSSLILFLHS